MTLKRAEIKEAIKKDYPNLPEYFINLVLDMHDCNPDWFKEDKKTADKITRKRAKKPQADKQEIAPVEIFGNVTIEEPTQGNTIIDLN